ncbi:hypothetical protein EMCRGX_G031171 [Ephydatia muelleri]
MATEMATMEVEVPKPKGGKRDRIDCSNLCDQVITTQQTDPGQIAASLLPTPEDDVALRDNICVLMSRILCAHVEFFKINFEDIVDTHIKHEFYDEMSMKSIVLHRELNQEIGIQYQNHLKSVLPTFDDNKKRAVQRGIDRKTSAWLTVIPMAYHHFDLSATEFRDSLALRYHQPLLRLPALCGSRFSTGHALDCRKGGLVIERHNQIRDALGYLTSIAYNEVVREPIIREPNDRENVPALVADLSVCGVWQPQATTFFDVRVVDSDANS